MAYEYFMKSEGSLSPFCLHDNAFDPYHRCNNMLVQQLVAKQGGHHSFQAPKVVLLLPILLAIIIIKVVIALCNTVGDIKLG